MNDYTKERCIAGTNILTCDRISYRVGTVGQPAFPVFLFL